MLLFKMAHRRGLFLALAAVAAMGLAGCSGFAPVYGDGQVAARSVVFAYAPPANRLELVIYDELSLRFGKTADPSAPQLSVRAVAASRDQTLTAGGNPRDAREVTVTATAILRDGPGGRQLLTVTRNGTAGYAVGPQGLANAAAETEARERAARSAAESLRLALFAGLGR